MAKGAVAVSSQASAAFCSRRPSASHRHPRNAPSATLFLEARMFITFEGVEGSGKTTQVALLAAALRQRGLPLLETREPGGSPVGPEIRRLLLAEGRHLTPATELLQIGRAHV